MGVMLTGITLMSHAAIGADVTTGTALREAAELSGEQARTRISFDTTTAPIIFRCETKVDALVDNTGEVTISDFQRVDFLLSYTSSGGQVDKRLTYGTGNIAKDEWTYSSSTPDVFNPGLWDPRETASLTSRLAQGPLAGTFGTLTVSTPNGITASSTVDFANAVSADCYYLHNNPTPPVADTASQAVLPISDELPVAPLLYNYDTDRDANPCLQLDKTNQGLGESDPTKYQVWRSGVLTNTLPITGTVLIDIFGTMENYVTALVGAVTVFLRDYDPGGPSHTEIIDWTVFARDWQEGSGDFVERMSLILGTNYTVPAGHELEAWVVVEDQSGDAMWLAYDTDDRPSVINLTYTPPLVSSSLYFQNNPTPPTADTNSQLTLPLQSDTPTATTLYNYDQERNGDAGLQINKGTLGLSETDPSKFQVWRSDALDTAWTIKGDVIVEVWISLKDFTLDKRGITTLYLRDYDPGLDTYTEIGPASLFDRNWQRGSSTWVKKSILVPGVDHTLPAGHMLEARLTVENQSDDAMWVAYDTTSQPTVMSFPPDTAVPVFVKQATLTVLDGWDAKNSDTLVNLGTVSQVQTSDDTRFETEPPASSYTSFQFSDLTLPGGSTITSVVIHVEHHQEADFTGSVTWRVGTGWPPGTEWGNTAATLRVGVGSETTDTWDVTSLVTTPTRVNDMELVIENNSTNGKKTNADYIYAVVQWDEP